MAKRDAHTLLRVDLLLTLAGSDAELEVVADDCELE